MGGRILGFSIMTLYGDVGDISVAFFYEHGNCAVDFQSLQSRSMTSQGWERTQDLGAIYTIEEQKPARTRRTVPALQRHKGGWRTFEYPSNR